MRWLRWTVVVFLSSPLWAQHTTVSATIVDGHGTPYANCTGTANFLGENTTPGAGPYTLGGSPFQTVVPIFCDSFGAFRVSLASNTSITPTPSQWRFSITSALGYTGGPYSFNAVSTITGLTQDVSSLLSAAAPLLPVSGGGGSMTWPINAGIPCYSGTQTWCGTYNNLNTIPNNFLGTFVPGSNGFGTGAFANISLYATLVSPTFSGTFTITGNTGCAQFATGVLTGTGQNCGVNGANLALSNLASVAINAPLSPGTDNSISLNSSSFRWINGWFNGVVGNASSGTPNSGVSFPSSGVTDIGNGTVGDISGTANAAAVVASSSVTVGSGSAACGSALACMAIAASSTGSIAAAANNSTMRYDLSSNLWKMTINGGAEYTSMMNYAPLALTSGTTISLVGPRQDSYCTSTCTVTIPAPINGYKFCIYNGDNVSTVITLAALGSSARYENTARTAFGTAGTGTFISTGAVKDFVCIEGLDATHYITTSSNGSWTAN